MGARRPPYPDHPPPSLVARRLTGPDDPDRQHPRWGLAPPIAGYLVATVTGGVGAAIGAGVSGSTTSLAALAGGLLGLWLGEVGAIVWASRLRGSGRPARDVALRFRPPDLVTGTATALAVSLVVVPVLYWALTALGVLDQESLDRLPDRAQDLVDVAGSGVGFIVLVLLVAVGTPFVEEAFFRGLLQPVLVGRLGAAPGLVVTAAVFASAHLQPLELPGLFAVGLALGYLRWRTGRLGASIVAHAVFNGLTLVSLASAA